MCLAIPAQIIEIVDPAGPMARVTTGGVTQVVNALCVAPDADPDSLIGRWVLVHVGFAMSFIDAEEAAAALTLLAELAEFNPDEAGQLR